MQKMKFYFLILVVLLFKIFVDANIHRAVPGSISASIAKAPKVQRGDIVIEDEDFDETLGYFERALLRKNVSWLCAIIASIVVGSTGIFPLFIFKVDDGKSLKEAISPRHLKLLLSFAVGGLLGDVFLHLLPESWMYVKGHDHIEHAKIGLWIIAGLLSFMIIEKIFMEEEKVRESLENNKIAKKHTPITKNTPDSFKQRNSVNDQTNGYMHSNGVVKHNECDLRKAEKDNIKDVSESSNEYSHKEIKVIGYLNLLANCSDNFTHGLAVAGSFTVSIPVGVCTTIAILLHEIPHEIGDFAILLKAGFKRWEAAKGQVLTASGAFFGCLFGLVAEHAGDSSSWILPYTSGGFIYIGMVTLVPDLVKEDDFKESIKQIIFLLAGISCMALVSTMQH